MSGLPPIRLHDLRHVAASLMLAAGVDVKIVSQTLGHSDSRITRDIYQSVMPKAGCARRRRGNGRHGSEGCRTAGRSGRRSGRG
ncbi:tyrosine-type recombinase/integrase [Streptomyces sp. NPDC054787]